MTGLADDAQHGALTTGAVTAGGWCAPSELVYDVIATEPAIHFPEVTVPRGGIRYDQSTAARMASERYRAMVARLIASAAHMREEATETAVRYAATHGYDVHVHNPPPFYYLSPDEALARQTYVGIEFTPARYPGVPTIWEHREDHTDLWGDDWSDVT